MRAVLDARCTNRFFRPAPPVSLVTAEGIANIAVDGDGGSEEGAALAAEFALAVADVQNAFHDLKIEEEHGQYFCYPFKVTAKEMGMVGHMLDGKRCDQPTLFGCAHVPYPWDTLGACSFASAELNLELLPHPSSAIALSCAIADRQCSFGTLSLVAEHSGSLSLLSGPTIISMLITWACWHTRPLRPGGDLMASSTRWNRLA